MTTKAIIASLKDNLQDFEWYPTTYDMLDVIKSHSQKEMNLAKADVDKFLSKNYKNLSTSKVLQICN
jgi:hypothetical protein